MKTIHDEEKLTAQIINILSYQQSITNQGTNYQGEKDWALNKIKELVNEVRLKTIDECIACVSNSPVVPLSSLKTVDLVITNLEQLKK